jgi:hypothetical protein
MDHCHNFGANNLSFRRKWKNYSGIYKITCLPFRFLYYYGSTNNFAVILKYHYFSGATRGGGLLKALLAYLSWEYFSVTIVELCPPSELKGN